MTRTRAIALTLGVALLLGCEQDLGPCDVTSATSPVYYDEGGFPAYPGQALVDASCGGAFFCHAQGISDEDRFGAPVGIDLDVAVTASPDEFERLQRARRVAWNLRHAIHAQVESGLMPPASPSRDTALGGAAQYRALRGTPDEVGLPAIDSAEGREMLRNWLACGAHVIEATEGESRGVGDIVPRGEDASCPAGQSACAEGCIDTTADPMNCGACGVVCGATQACTDGACRCLGDLDACGPDCVDVRTNVDNCGECGLSCGARFCADATCVDACPDSTMDCGGSCVDLTTSVANCGGCGVACGAGEGCVDGSCLCAGGFTRCVGGCVDLQADTQNCGACEASCEGAAVCTGGACACPSGTEDCGGVCADVASDNTNCGACGNECPAGESCSSGSCVGCGSAVSFASDVGPLLDQRCASSRCHGGARPAASLNLTLGRAYAELVGAPASCGGNPLVTPGSVDSSYLVNKLLGVDMCSGNRMPKADESLSQAELDVIRSWICRGANDD